MERVATLVTFTGHIFACVALLAICIHTSASAGHLTQLSIKGDKFTINGEPKFLLGISYYGALGAPKEFILKDLDDIQRYGFNWLRVWATWAAFGEDVSAVDTEGNPREPFLSKLIWLVEECDKRGLIVDVTLSRGNAMVGPKRLQTLEAHMRAVSAIVEALKAKRNWYIDLGNERNIRDSRFVSFDDLKMLRDEVKRIDPKRLVTASYAGDMSQDELREYILNVGVDFVAIHRPRNPQSPKQTAERTKQLMEWMRKLGRIVPIHYQEPFRRGFTKGWEPTAEEFLADLKGAIESGAAGWCFHNGAQGNVEGNFPRRSFDMRKQRLFEQLDAEEHRFLNMLGKL
ncbi:MAG: hypothetical protein RMK18_11980 [Armatimonadota bacterium]|nr:hypothetical protein [Armatimonadota bacterium]MDW8026566.1 hypothetical protein [Armatimonadota bacterium]